MSSLPLDRAAMMHIKVRLACCGHVLEHATATESDAPFVRGETIYEPLRMWADVLSYWLDNRIERHRCHLVSESNPNGLISMKEAMELRNAS